MKLISYKHLINQAFNDLSTEIEESGLGHILTFEEIDDIIFESYTYDAKNQCFWIISAKELVTIAYELTLIDDKQLEDWYLWSIFKVK